MKPVNFVQARRNYWIWILSKIQAPEGRNGVLTWLIDLKSVLGHLLIETTNRNWQMHLSNQKTINNRRCRCKELNIWSIKYEIPFKSLNWRIIISRWIVSKINFALLSAIRVIKFTLASIYKKDDAKNRYSCQPKAFKSNIIIIILN